MGKVQADCQADIGRHSARHKGHALSHEVSVAIMVQAPDADWFSGISRFLYGWKVGLMIRKELPPAQVAELKFLRQQVDFWAEARLKMDASPSANQRYWSAKSDLTKFVSNRRKEGYEL